MQLRNDCAAQIMNEVELTLRVAVMSAAGMTRGQIVTALDARDIEVRMAMIRLERIAGAW